MIKGIKLNGVIEKGDKSLSIDELMNIFEVVGIDFTGDWNYIDENYNVIVEDELKNKANELFNSNINILDVAHRTTQTTQKYLKGDVL